MTTFSSSRLSVMYIVRNIKAHMAHVSNLFICTQQSYCSLSPSLILLLCPKVTWHQSLGFRSEPPPFPSLPVAALPHPSAAVAARYGRRTCGAVAPAAPLSLPPVAARPCPAAHSGAALLCRPSRPSSSPSLANRRRHRLQFLSASRWSSPPRIERAVLCSAARRGLLPVWIRRGLLLRRRRGAVRLQVRRRGSRAPPVCARPVRRPRECPCPRARPPRARLLPVAALCSAAGPSKLCASALLCWCSAQRKGGGALLCLVLCSGGALLCSAVLLRSGWFCLISKPAARHLVAGAIILLLWCCTRRLRTEKVPCCCLWRLQVIFSAIEVPSSLLQ